MASSHRMVSSYSMSFFLHKPLCTMSNIEVTDILYAYLKIQSRLSTHVQTLLQHPGIMSHVTNGAKLKQEAHGPHRSPE
jgi:hypothetical protein